MIEDCQYHPPEGIHKSVYVVFELGSDKVQTSSLSPGEGNSWGSDSWKLPNSDNARELQVVVYEKHALRSA